MKIIIGTSFLSLCLLYLEADAFSIRPNSRIASSGAPPRFTTTSSTSGSDNQPLSTTSAPIDATAKARIQTLGKIILDRSDTLQSAGFYDPQQSEYPPLVAGAKTNITLFLLALGYKWYRSIFINKLAIWERQPQWNTVITSKEDEEKANLEAMTCKNCGSTIFIAKGRKWFQMPKGYTCYCCGASGEENFTNTREELLDEIDDDYFDYEKPLDFVTAAERKKLMKQAGGDEAKANALLTQGRAALEEGDKGTSTAGVDDGESKKKKKKKKKKTKSKEEKEVQGDDAGNASPSMGSEESGSVATATKGGDELKKDKNTALNTGKSPSKDNDDDDDLSILGMD